MSRRAGAPAALAVGVATLLILLGLVLLESKPRLAGTNQVRDPVFAAVVPGGQAVCQSGELVPADADRVRLLVGTYGARRPPLTLTMLGPGTRLTSRIPPGVEGAAFFRVPRTERAVGGVTVCIRNEGARRIAIAGEGVPPVAKVGRADADGRIRLAWYRPGKENWFQLAGTILHRFGYGNAPWFGGWLLGLVALLLAGAGAAAVWAVLREPDEAETEQAGAEPEGGW